VISLAPRPSPLAPAVTVSATPFAIPYRRPLALAPGSVTEHCAVLIEIVDRDGCRGAGEIAPGPGTTRARAGAIALDVTAQRDRIAAAAHGVFDALDANRRTQLCGLDPGVEAALLDLWARRRGEPLGLALRGGSADATQVIVNAMIDRAETRVVRDVIDAAVADGYRCLKLKMAPTDTEACCAALSYARGCYGDAIALRVDCNGAWTVPEARDALRSLACFDLEYVEQPAATLEDLRALRETTGVRIAADESVANISQIERAIALRAVDVMILKPARLGVLDALRGARMAIDAGIDCVVTSNLESSLGLASALHVAAAVDAMSARPARAHGLGTAQWLEADIAAPRLLARHGVLDTNGQPGCGVAPVADLVERWRIH